MARAEFNCFLLSDDLLECLCEVFRTTFGSLETSLVDVFKDVIVLVLCAMWSMCTHARTNACINLDCIAVDSLLESCGKASLARPLPARALCTDHHHHL